MKPLTDLQRQALLMLARGFSQKQVAVQLGTNRMTLANRCQRATFRLGARNTLHAVVLALNAGILSMEEIIGKDDL